MKITMRAALFLFFALALAMAQRGTAQAQSSYFTSQGCSGCHTAPVVATCNGCHAHGTHPTSAKSTINVTGTTNKSSYAPGETVTVTINGGYRTGWFRAVLYDQNTVELARSTGTASGMGSSATYPATLTAPAPATAGTYTWKVAWYGNQYDKAASPVYGTGWTPDPTNPNHGYEIVNISSPFTVVAAPVADTTAPVVSAFTLPATAASLTVPVSSLTATDAVGVTGYLVTTSATAPTAAAAGWSATAPAGVTAAAAGSTTFYAWAKDAAGNVSASASATVVITLPPAGDTTAPVVSAFTLPATSTSLTIPVTALAASDNIGVTGYLVTTNATAPAAGAAGWSATAPASVIAPGIGSVNFYVWAKDAAGNVSIAITATVVVTMPTGDVTAPTVDAFTLPATASSLTVPVDSFTATDNVGVTGYLVTTSASVPAAGASGWSATPPTSVTAAAPGSVTFYAWARDAAGNVSASASASVTITADTSDLSLFVSTLPDGSYTNDPTLNISGTVVDSIAIKSFTINGHQVDLSSDGSFTTALHLHPGSNIVTVTAIDTAKDKKTDKRIIHYDATAPRIRMTTPADNSKTAQSFITVSGVVNETSAVNVTVNSNSPQAAAIDGKKFSATINLEVGVNTIGIEATDQVGNVSHAKRTVIYDNAAPSLAVASPVQDITTDQKTLLLSGTVSDAQTKVRVVITMNGRKYYSVVNNGIFQRRLVFGAAKLYAITVTATDEAGNISTAQRNVIYDPKYGSELNED